MRLEQVYHSRVSTLRDLLLRHGHHHPMLPVDANIDHMPITLNNPITNSVEEKLHHQQQAFERAFRAYLSSQPPRISLDALGHRAYEQGGAEKYFNHANIALTLMQEVHLLSAACAFILGNMVFTVDLLSTQVSTGILQEVIANLDDNARLLRNVHSPLTIKLWQYAACTSHISVTTVTPMQLLKLTEVFVKLIMPLLTAEMRTVIKTDFFLESTFNRSDQPKTALGQSP